jgi:hypothetical protein
VDTIPAFVTLISSAISFLLPIPAQADQNVLRCAMVHGEVGTNLTYDANGMRCVQGSGGCDFYEESRSAVGIGKIDQAVLDKGYIGHPANAVTRVIGEKTPACYRVSLARQPRWISSATWVEGLKQLVVVDPLGDDILAYKPSGELGSIPKSLVKMRQEFHPTVISPDGSSGFLVEGLEGELQRLDNELRPQISEPHLKYKSPDGTRIGSLYQWKAAGDSLLAYGTLIDKNSQPANGFFYVPLRGSAKPLGMLRPLDDSSYYLLGNSYIAIESGAYYFVAMDKNPSLYRVSPPNERNSKQLTIKQLDVLPNEYRVCPEFKTRMKGRNSAAPHFAELETFSVISGLYAQDGLLYILVRRPNGLGRTSWLLFQIDPNKPKIIGHIILPTSANFLTVIPSPKKWFLLERGPLSEGQRQEIKSLLVIDKFSIASLAPMPIDCPTR